MTDRERLELAAKAVGLSIDKSETNGGGRGNTGFDSCGNAMLDWHNNVSWNPLTNDGDALRLAVKLRLGVTHNDPRSNNAYVMADGAVFTKGQIVSITETEDVEDESGRQDATRRAIVRAAAQIGKAMP